jgi:hypothetical protein
MRVEIYFFPDAICDTGKWRLESTTRNNIMKPSETRSAVLSNRYTFRVHLTRGLMRIHKDHSKKTFVKYVKH